MIRITDITLSKMNFNFSTTSKTKLLELYKLLLLTGINYIEINENVYSLIGESVDYDKTILRVEHPNEIMHYPGFVRYVCRYSGFEVPVCTISEVQVNDIREINRTNKFNEYQHIRIVGMDDLFQHDYLSTFERIKKSYGSQIEFCPQNSYYCATAMAVEWILHGGINAAVSFCGTGGFAALEEVVMALRLIKRHKPNLNLSFLSAIRNLYEDLSGEKLPHNKAIVGTAIFKVESGIHVDGIFKNGSNYEPFEPSVVGAERKIVIGKHSGRATIEVKLEEHALSCPKECIPELLYTVQMESIRHGRSITDQEFIKLAQNYVC